MLARRVLITEGSTEYEAFPAASRRLSELHPAECKTLECLGIAVFNAETDSQVAALGEYFRKLGKTVFAVFDKQSDAARGSIKASVPHAFESPEKGFENVVIKNTAEVALRRYAVAVVAGGEWPPHLAANAPTAATPTADLHGALASYFRWSKGAGSVADLLGQCSREEMPAFIVDTLSVIQQIVEPPPPAIDGLDNL
ncbi:MAG: TOPRIM nucleotidyl transferase/hydrolase domain-containing protein [Haliea sp.]